MIHLRQSDTVVREITSKASGFVFEVAVQGYPSRIWMASSEEERQAWIKAIQAAMIGEEDIFRKLDLRPHQTALDTFSICKAGCFKSVDLQSYTAIVQTTATTLAPLTVPLQWIRNTYPVVTKSLSEIGKESKSHRSPHRLLRTSIQQFWEQLGQTSFDINDTLVPHDSPLGADLTIGGLTRCILEVDKAFTPEAEDEERGDFMSELQAVSYSREILMSSLRSKERHDSLFAVTTLLAQQNLVVIEPHPEEPVHIEVSWPGEDSPEESAPLGNSSDISGWVKTKVKKAGSKWRKRYVVLSGSVLSYYEAASPRPHGLQGQTVFENTFTVEQEGDDENPFAISVGSEEKRLLAFESDGDLQEWKMTIEAAIESCSPALVSTPSGSLSKSLLKGAERVIKGAIPGDSIRGGIRVIKGAKDGGIKVIRSAKDGGIKVIRGGIRGARGILRPSHRQSDTGNRQRIDMKRRPSMQMLMNNATRTDKRDPTVQCVVQATQAFDVIPKDGSEVIFSVHSKLFQAFLLSGGGSGQISRGDALFEIEFVGIDIPDDTEHRSTECTAKEEVDDVRELER